ncbi:MAG: ABC transporter ATP-binding protein [Sneathiella sp.]|uniref:ABC transporter ATP-binding protein n=1 Tax=Sneathiella sp. TaxID=1964365 RepID=UPI0030025462
MLKIQNVSKSYDTPQGKLTVLKGVGLELAAGSSMALMGESGSGKSTLLHLIAGLDRVDAGNIFVQGQNITRFSETERASLRLNDFGIIFQQFNLVPSLKVKDNMAFQARLAGRYDPEWQSELVSRLGLETLMDRYLEQLSGGQQQRVAIGRAFAGKPSLLLADEPTGNLDESTANEVLALAMDLVKRTGASFLMVTHSAHFASFLDRQVTLRAGRLT